MEYSEYRDGIILKDYNEFIKNDVKSLEWLDTPYVIPFDQNGDLDPVTKHFSSTYNLGLGLNKDGLITSRVLDIELLIVMELERLSVSVDRIKELLKNFKKQYTRNKDNTWIKYYVSKVFQKMSVNIYIVGDNIEPRLAYEHDMIVQEERYIDTSITISLNGYMTLMYEDDFINTREERHYLSKAEWDLIQNLRTNKHNLDYKKEKIEVYLNKNGIKSIDIIGKECDLNKYKEIQERIMYGSIGIENYKGKKQVLKIKEKKKYTDDQELLK